MSKVRRYRVVRNGLGEFDYELRCGWNLQIYAGPPWPHWEPRHYSTFIFTAPSSLVESLQAIVKWEESKSRDDLRQTYTVEFDGTAISAESELRLITDSTAGEPRQDVRNETRNRSV